MLLNSLVFYTCKCSYLIKVDLIFTFINTVANGRTPMDLGIAGRKAIVCASSRGLGRACAQALAAAGCEVVINGRDQKVLDATVTALRQIACARVIGVAADVATAEGQAALFAACPEPDILVNNNA